MLVYRIENDNGVGPFVAGDDWDFYPLDYHPGQAFMDFPRPDDDGLLFEEDIHKCGCASLRQLIHWFPKPVRTMLTERNYKLVVLDIPDERVQVGQYQVIFEAEGSR